MKTIAKSLLLLLPLMFFAQQNPSKTLTQSVELTASAENAWNALTDFSTFQQWDTNVVAVRCPEKLKKNQNCQLISKTGELVDVEIVDLVENNSYTVRFKLSSGNFYIKRSLDSSGNLTLTETVWYTGISTKTFVKYKGSDYATFMKNRILRFKKFLEAKEI